MLNPWMQQVRDWQTFYTLTGSAAATLLALMFVVISLGMASLGPNMSGEGVRAFVTPTVVYFAAVLMLAALMIMPVMTPLLLGGLLGLGGLGGIGYIVVIRVDGIWRRSKLPWDDWYWHVALPVVVDGLLIAAGLCLWLGWSPGMICAALADLLLLMIGIRNAWDLAIWMAQQRRNQSPPPPPES